MDKKKVSEFLKQLRQERNLSQEGFVEEFSKFLNCEEVITVATVSKWERGESFPDINNLKDLARFYNVSMDEIFNGEREEIEDYTKKYFIYNNDWCDKYNPDDLWEIRNKQEQEIELKFDELLGKLVKNILTVSEEKEFDFICDNFYYLKDKLTIEEVKFQVRKQCALMHKSNFNEKLWEAYKFFDYDKKIDFFKDLCDNVFDGGAKIIGERIKNSPDFQKDVLLAFVQKNNITHRYGKSPNKLFFKQYGIEYDEEKLTKQVIRLLIENGACLNDALLGYYVRSKTKRNVLDMLEKGYYQYKKPILVAVFEDSKYSYYLIKNTEKNRELYDTDYAMYDIKEDILPDLEKRLYNGETEFFDEHEYWHGIEDVNNFETCRYEILQEGIFYVTETINKMSYSDYYKCRKFDATKELLKDLDVLSLSQIREKYFTLETKEDE